MAETYASQLLQQVTLAVGVQAVATVMQVPQRTVARWEVGAETPTPQQQDALQGYYNLPSWAWYNEPVRDAVQATSVQSAPETAGSTMATFQANAESLDLLNAQLERVSSDINTIRNNVLGGVNYSELSKQERLYTTIVEKRAQVAGHLRAIEENRLARTETFRAHCRRILEAVRPFPEARVAIIKAMGLDVEDPIVK